MGQSVESELYWDMNAIVDRFQEPINREAWLAGQNYSDLVDLSKIRSVPIAMFIGEIDNVCPLATAEKYIPEIQSETTKIVIEGKGHMYFLSRANSAEFMAQLVEQLQIPTTDDDTIIKE